MEAVKQIGSQAEQLVSEYHLGAVKAEYRDDWRKTVLVVALCLPVSLIVIALFLPALLFSSPASTGGWPQWLEQVGNMLPILMFGVCFLLIGLIGIAILAITLWKGARRVYIGEKGFISAHRRIEVAARWEAVREIRRRVIFVNSKSTNVQQTTLHSSYFVFPVEGRVCSFSNDLGTMVEKSVTACLLPQILEKYDAGQLLSFDWLALDQQGIHLTPDSFSKEYTTALAKLPGVSRTPKKLQGTAIETGEQVLSWSKLELFWIDESHSTLIISRKATRRHWAILPLYRVSNAALCIALVDHALHDGAREVA